MNVTLRKRNQGGKTSLYLDYYWNGKRRTESLKLYLYPNPNSKEKRLENKSTLQLAEAICAKRRVEIQNGFFGFKDDDKRKGSFVKYMEKLADQRRSSGTSNFDNWDGMIKHFKKFMPNDITFNQVDADLVADFKEYPVLKNL